MALRVWWIPQVGAGIESFKVEVNSVREGVLLLNTLANYDLYQLENRIKPDYCNTGGLQMLEDGEWVDWEIDDPQIGYYDDPEEYIEFIDMTEEM